MSSVLLCGGKFYFLSGNCSLFDMCDVNYSVLLLRISFHILYIYIYIYIYIYARPGVCVVLLRKITQHWCVFDCVTVLFIPLWKLSFVHMC